MFGHQYNFEILDRNTPTFKFGTLHPNIWRRFFFFNMLTLSQQYFDILVDYIVVYLSYIGDGTKKVEENTIFTYDK